MMGLMLLLIMPVGVGDRSTGQMLIYLTLPGYMLHQVEEHWGDRFRIFVNTHVFGGLEALSVGDVLWINLPGVWGVNLLCLYASALWGPGWGLTAVYLMLVNGLTHIASAAASRVYNPGLVTSLVIFMPLSIAGLALIPAAAPQHILGLAVSLAIHAAIVARVVGEAKALRKAG